LRWPVWSTDATTGSSRQRVSALINDEHDGVRSRRSASIGAADGGDDQLLRPLPEFAPRQAHSISSEWALDVDGNPQLVSMSRR